MLSAVLDVCMYVYVCICMVASEGTPAGPSELRQGGSGGSPPSTLELKLVLILRKICNSSHALCCCGELQDSLSKA